MKRRDFVKALFGLSVGVVCVPFVRLSRLPILDPSITDPEKFSGLAVKHE